MSEKLTRDIVFQFMKQKYDEIREYDVNAVRQLSEILEEAKREFADHEHFVNRNYTQSWRSLAGGALEKAIRYIIQSDLDKIGLRCVEFKKSRFMPEANNQEVVKEVEKLREQGKRVSESKIRLKIGDSRYEKIEDQIKVFVDDAQTLAVKPDVDLVVYDPNTLCVMAILSIKKRFRERITQVAYWTIKLRKSANPIKNFLVTLDEDREFRGDKSDEVRKGKAIASVDINGTYVASENEIVETEKIKNFPALIDDIKQLWRSSKGSNL